jgi:hypothetical protein
MAAPAVTSLGTPPGFVRWDTVKAAAGAVQPSLKGRNVRIFAFAKGAAAGNHIATFMLYPQATRLAQLG